MIGIDLVEIERIKNLKSRDRFIERFFSKNEIAYLKTKSFRDESIAGIFACKEAFLKVLGEGLFKVPLREIEILHDDGGRPFLNLSNSIKKKLIQRNMSLDLSISISHERSYRLGVCVGKEKITSHEDVLNLQNDLCLSLLKRDKKSHKGNYGRVGIIGGKKGMGGSIFLSSLGALRTGSGLVYILSPKSMVSGLEAKAVEQIIIPIEDDDKGFFTGKSISGILDEIKNFDSLCIGPGMGRENINTGILREVIRNTNIPILIDADGLNRLAKDPDILREKNGEIIITPHEMELSRLLGIDVKDVSKDRIYYAQEFSKKYNIICVLKGHESVISDGDIYYLNNSGNPSMATPGSGDVLSGVILSFLGQGYRGLLSARLGTYIHGLSGDICRFYLGESGVLASDIAYNITGAMKYLEEKRNELQ